MPGLALPAGDDGRVTELLSRTPTRPGSSSGRRERVSSSRRRMVAATRRVDSEACGLRRCSGLDLPTKRSATGVGPSSPTSASTGCATPGRWEPPKSRPSYFGSPIVAVPRLLPTSKHLLPWCSYISRFSEWICRGWRRSAGRARRSGKRRSLPAAFPSARQKCWVNVTAAPSAVGATVTWASCAVVKYLASTHPSAAPATTSCA